MIHFYIWFILAACWLATFVWAFLYTYPWKCKICNRRPYPNDNYCKGHDDQMTIKDAIDMWLASHKLTIIQSYAFGGWTCRDQDTKGTLLSLSNHMSLSFSEEDGFIQITGSLSKKSYKVHISDPSLFPMLDRALDEEDKWIRDGQRAPE